MSDCRIEEAGLNYWRVRQRLVEPRSFVLAAGCAPDNHRVHSFNTATAMNPPANLLDSCGWRPCLCQLFSISIFTLILGKHNNCCTSTPTQRYNDRLTANYYPNKVNIQRLSSYRTSMQRVSV